MESGVDPDARIITPQGLPLGIIVVSSIFLFFSILLTALRSHVRWNDGVFGYDDGLMVAGTVAYAGSVGTAIYAQLTGIGSLDIKLNQWRREESMKIHTIWLLVYVLAMTLVKASICITLRRIAETKRALRITVWVLLGITLVSFVAAFAGTILQCMPFEAHWKSQLIESGDAKCAPVIIFIALGYIATVCTIFTDAALVVIPALLLWRSQMKFQAKLQVFGLLSFASAASIITIVRIPYVQRYDTKENLHFWIAHIVLCSLIETGVGCMASSFPSLRRFVKQKSDTEIGNSNEHNNNSGNIITFGGSSPKDRGRGGFRNQTDVGISLGTIQGRCDIDRWERLNDGESVKGELLAREEIQGIRANNSYSVESEPEFEPERYARKGKSS